MLPEIGDSGFRRALAARALEQERLGHYTDHQNAHLARDAGDHRAGAGAGAAAHAGGDEQHVRARHLGADLVHRLFRRRLADFRLRSGAEAFRQVDAELQAVLGAGGRERLSVGVGDHELDARQAGGDHVVDGVAAGAADADHRQPRSQIGERRQLQVDAHRFLASPEAGRARASCPPARIRILPGTSATSRRKRRRGTRLISEPAGTSTRTLEHSKNRELGKQTPGTAGLAPRNCYCQP